MSSSPGVFHPSWAGGSRQTFSQWHTSLWMQHLQKELWPLCQLRATHERPLSGKNKPVLIQLATELSHSLILSWHLDCQRNSFCWCFVFKGKKFWVQDVRKDLQTLLNVVHSPADPLGHTAVPLPVLRQEIPPEIWYEETHLHPHRWDAVLCDCVFVMSGLKRDLWLWLRAHAVNATSITVSPKPLPYYLEIRVISLHSFHVNH